MGNEVGKGKYAKMDQAELTSNDDPGKSNTKNGNVIDEIRVEATNDNSAVSKLKSLKQGVSSGYHSIVLSPRPDDTRDSHDYPSNTNTDDR